MVMVKSSLARGFVADAGIGASVNLFKDGSHVHGIQISLAVDEASGEWGFITSQRETADPITATLDRDNKRFSLSYHPERDSLAEILAVIEDVRDVEAVLLYDTTGTDTPEAAGFTRVFAARAVGGPGQGEGGTGAAGRLNQAGSTTLGIAIKLLVEGADVDWGLLGVQRQVDDVGASINWRVGTGALRITLPPSLVQPSQGGAWSIIYQNGAATGVTIDQANNRIVISIPTGGATLSDIAAFLRAATYTGRAGTPDFGNSVQFGTGGSVVVTTGTQSVSQPGTPVTVQGFSGGLDAQPLSAAIATVAKTYTIFYDATEDNLGEIVAMINSGDDAQAKLFYGTRGTAAPEAVPFTRPFQPVGGTGEDGEDGVSPAALTEALVEIFNGTLNVQGNAVAAGSAVWGFDTYDRYFVATRYGNIVEIDKAALQGLTAGAAGAALSAAQHIDVTGRALGQPGGSDELHLGKSATDGILVAADDNTAFDGVIKIWGAEAVEPGSGESSGPATSLPALAAGQSWVGPENTPTDIATQAELDAEEVASLQGRIQLQENIDDESRARVSGDQANADALTAHAATTHGGGSGPGAGVVKSKAADYTIVDGDEGDSIRLTGAQARTFTLPDIDGTDVTIGWEVVLINDSSAVLSVRGNSTDTINDSTVMDIPRRESRRVQAVTATSWTVIGDATETTLAEKASETALAIERARLDNKADTSLVQSEAQARANADTALGTRITALESGGATGAIAKATNAFVDAVTATGTTLAGIAASARSSLDDAAYMTARKTARMLDRVVKAASTTVRGVVLLARNEDVDATETDTTRVPDVARSKRLANRLIATHAATPHGGGSGGGVLTPVLVPASASAISFGIQGQSTWPSGRARGSLELSGTVFWQDYRDLHGKQYIIDSNHSNDINVHMADLMSANTASGGRNTAQSREFEILNRRPEGRITFSGGGIADITPVGANLLPGYKGKVSLTPWKVNRWLLALGAFTPVVELPPFATITPVPAGMAGNNASDVPDHIDVIFSDKQTGKRITGVVLSIAGNALALNAATPISLIDGASELQAMLRFDISSATKTNIGGNTQSTHLFREASLRINFGDGSFHIHDFPWLVNNDAFRVGGADVKVHTQNLDFVTAHRGLSTGWTIPATGSYYAVVKSNSNELLVFVDLPRGILDALAVTTANADLSQASVTLDYLLPTTPAGTYRFAKTAADVLLMGSSNTAGDPEPLEIWRRG